MSTSHEKLAKGDFANQQQRVAAWDATFADGSWGFLGNLSEAARYAIIAGYCLKLASSERIVLDIGCGNGELLRYLEKLGYKEYVGLDISGVAVEQARSLQTPRTSFQVGSFETADLSSLPRFDLIVLNEVLYYLTAPEAALERVAGFTRSSWIRGLVGDNVHETQEGRLFRQLDG